MCNDLLLFLFKQCKQFWGQVTNRRECLTPLPSFPVGDDIESISLFLDYLVISEVFSPFWVLGCLLYCGRGSRVGWNMSLLGLFGTCTCCNPKGASPGH